MQDDRNIWQILRDGIFVDNTIFRLAISLCPAIAVTNKLMNGIMMGVAVMFVQTMVNLTVSLMRQFIHPRIRIPIFMLVISGWVSVTDMLMNAFAHDVYKEVGLYIQLIVAFASILAHAETFASKNPPVKATADGVGMGAGFMVALVIISFFRELLGKGTLLEYPIVDFKPLLIMILPTGGFIAVGLLMGFFNWIDIKFYGGKGAGGAG
ncbi:MAG: electron transport complex subunit RsxE [Nitrospirota bacterium]|jgi:electron transport complex protein RnfE